MSASEEEIIAELQDLAERGWVDATHETQDLIRKVAAMFAAFDVAIVETMLTFEALNSFVTRLPAAIEACKAFGADLAAERMSEYIDGLESRRKQLAAAVTSRGGNA